MPCSKKALERQDISCSVQTLSRVIASEGLTNVDLLKIDVEKGELAALQGLREEDWPKIRQIVVEVHDQDGRLDRIRDLLSSHGFEFTLEQDDMFAGTDLYNIYANSPRAHGQQNGTIIGIADTSDSRGSAHSGRRTHSHRSAAKITRIHGSGRFRDVGTTAAYTKRENRPQEPAPARLRARRSARFLGAIHSGGNPAQPDLGRRPGSGRGGHSR